MDDLKYICKHCNSALITKNIDNNKKYFCNKCNKSYKIIKNIPRFVNLDNYSNSFGFQWNKFRKTQLDSYTNLSISKKRVLKATGWENLKLNGKVILEAGSGAGRFTEILAKTGAKIYSFDYSNAVEANQKNNGFNKNVNFFQGNIFEIPFKDESFDHVICLGVIQHTPNPEEAFFALSQAVKKGGQLTIDSYRKSWYHLLRWKYWLRPITKKIEKRKLFQFISFITPLLIPLTKFFKFFFGKAGAYLVPIVEFSNLIEDKKLNNEWAILDTFDMYSPEHDHPKTKKDINLWFEKNGYKNIEVFYGDNGIVGRGTKK